MRRYILKTDADVTSAMMMVEAAFAQTRPDCLYEVIIRPAKESRNLEQNSALWAALTDISEQVVWHGQKYSPEDWKDIISAAWRGERYAPGIGGGVVALGISTSKLPKEDFSELLEYIYAWGTEQGVKFETKRAP